MKAFIKAISYYLPPAILNNADLNEMFPEWSVDKISSKTGIYERHISDPNTFSSDLGIKAAQKMFSDHNISPDTIDYVLFCTQSPDYFLPTNAGALDFNLGCSGFVYGLSLAKGLILAEEATNILLITAETYSKFINPNDKSNRTIFGDGAAATLISSEGGFAEILKGSVGSDGRGAGNLIVKNGGMRFKANVSSKNDSIDEYGNIHNESYLYMNGSEIFNFTSEMVPKLVNSTLVKNSISQEDIDLYIFHQANKFMLNHLRKKLSISEDRFYYFLEKCGNTVSSSIPIALYESLNDGSAKGNVLLAGFGVGYSWAGTILKLNINGGK